MGMLEYIPALLGPSRNLIIAIVVCLVLGCLIGWMVFGWLIWPVSWTDADPYDLRREHKEAYVAMVADSYSINNDRQLAEERMGGFEEEEAREIMLAVIQGYEEAGDAPGALQGAQNVRDLAGVLGISLEGEVPAPEPTPQPPSEGIVGRILSTGRSVLPVCGVFIIVLLIVALIAIIVYRLIMRRPAEVPAEEMVREELVRWEAIGEETLGHFVTTYHFGDDGYDTSFNVETPDPEGEFYGACGVGFSETMGEGSPDRIVAFEIWIFDKTDLDNVETVTKVLMSEYAYHNEILRVKMKDRGEPVLAEKGKTIVVDAVGMKLNAEIVDMAYGTDPNMPPNSYFETLTTELVPVLKASQM
jgi:hypothetical protein